jgi:hypothetical protein
MYLATVFLISEKWESLKNQLAQLGSAVGDILRRILGAQAFQIELYSMS